MSDNLQDPAVDRRIDHSSVRRYRIYTASHNCRTA